MTEYDLFVSNIPMIAEMTVRCRRLEQRDYEDFKNEVMESASNKEKRFIRKVFIVMDKYVLNR